jgi:hypothetical protein
MHKALVAQPAANKGLGTEVIDSLGFKNAVGPLEAIWALEAGAR